jgi:ubiquinone/menaquinone biosynthesis C-methylase UbiE
MAIERQHRLRLSIYRIILYLYGVSSPWVRHKLLWVLFLFWSKDAQSTPTGEEKQAKDITPHDFYQNNMELYRSADATTADTNRHLADLKKFILLHQDELQGGQILDIGCGNIERLIGPVADAFPMQRFLGIDIVQPTMSQADMPSNFTFNLGDFSNIPLADNSCSAVLANWSVLNDLTNRRQQLLSLAEVSRVLIPGGYFYFDVPVLEGTGGYYKQAKLYSQKHPEVLFGMITRVFGCKEKRFYIYPHSELLALLEYNSLDYIQSHKWQTPSGQTRETYLCRLGVL